MTVRFEPFNINIPQSALDDLRERLGRTRFPEQLPDAEWDYGTELGYLRELVTYWRDDYDWRGTEARLNGFQQFTTTIDGARIHFLHVRSPEPHALPIVLTHGWPDSVSGFLDVIGPLTNPRAHGGDPADAFHVVVPSLPGYAFSGPTRERGWHPGRVASAWAALMAGLGYERYVAQGGDWGSFVTSQLAIADPAHCAGIHLNFLPTIPMTDDHTEEEVEFVADMARYNDEDSGYFKEQSTKPQTVGYALEDSPAGLAAWIVEKFRTWSDCDGDVERSFTKDQLLDNISVYWFTATAHSSARMYYEFDKGLKNGTMDLFSKITQPVGYARYPKEIMRTSQRWAEAQFDLVHFADMPRGGHFAAGEVPDLFVPDVRAWAANFR
ncbi:MAG: epoxide hydrolase [Acidimicrobiia bacterium]|nr:epoxide hydrolase [Acidimicrobiia bacterium]